MNQFDQDAILNNMESNQPEKVYVAAITQTGTAKPTLSVMRDTTGTIITASYGGVGIARIVAAKAIFTASKTLPLISGLGVSHAAARIRCSTTTVVRIETASGANPAKFASFANALLSATPFEIRVY